MISNRCARKSLVTNCNSIISKNYLRFLVDSNDIFYINNAKPDVFVLFKFLVSTAIHYIGCLSKFAYK